MWLHSWSHHSLLQKRRQWHSSHTQTLEPKSDHEKIAHIIHCAQRIWTRFVLCPTLAWQRSWLSWTCGVEWWWHPLKKLRCWDVHSMSSLHEWKKFVNSRRTPRWTQRWQDSRKLRERWESRCRHRAERTWESESQSRTHLVKTSTTGTSRSTDTRVCSILLSPPCWKQRDNHQQWWWRLHHMNITMLTQKGARKVVRNAGNNVFEAYRQLCFDVRNVR